MGRLSVSVPAIDRQVERRLAERDVRYTKGRRAVVDAMARVDGPRSAAELHRTMSDEVPLSSLYRSLAVLEEAGILAPHFSTKGVTRYELAEWLAGHHHHLLCLECGEVTDVRTADGLEDELLEIVGRIGATVGFTPTNHALDIEGRCSSCS
jgi:Fur family transcriptional regulator, ferric uptake regulator